MPVKDEPEDFSPATAQRAIEELYDAIPKSKRGLFLGHLNEALVVLSDLVKVAKVNPEKRVRA